MMPEDNLLLESENDPFTFLSLVRERFDVDPTAYDFAPIWEDRFIRLVAQRRTRLERDSLVALGHNVFSYDLAATLRRIEGLMLDGMLDEGAA